MKLNCDMGESFGAWQMGNDQAVMPWIDMANIACGFHASDPDIMAQTVAWAISHHVEIGAHPGYDDKVGFGRRSVPHSLTSIAQLVAYQAGALNAICQLQGSRISYIKPHGALYNDMMADEAIFEAIIKAVAGLNRNQQIDLKLMILAKSDNANYQEIAQYYKVQLLLEAFADRAYSEAGLLVPRSQPGAVYYNTERIKQQVVELAQGRVTTISGETLFLKADTVCVHGDNEQSIATIAALHKVLNP
ncbi:5-oxoprolinase subunit PxpA [Photobacterium sp. SDRW27]|uniref:5-oxoprolinase subunit PxpA n=1 Tax=Photobacterium obscurum TaxID=2829490 RepID=UPI002244F313|nr:5-oxoprolinase subunit PxpA [Photobacterium obscurum]MCW8331212.1 5-oxoprolinase subunit PxpA [Photobacterium obscurum]